MKNLVSLICLLALLMCGCTHEELIRNDSSSANGRIFTTSFENNESRTYLEDGKYSYWTEGDRISLFDGHTLNQPYIFSGETGDDSGTFFTLSKPEGTGMALNTNYAVYPYSKDVKISSNGVITVSLPHEQHYAENSYGLGDNTMVAVTENVEDTFLYFKNVGGYIKLQLYGNDITVKSISLTGNNGEKIAGKATITAVYNEAPVVTMADDATTSITLDCGEKGVKIGATPKRATAFWFVVPPTTFEKGFTIKVKDVDGKVYTQTTDKQLAIKRNVVKPMAAVEATQQSIEIPYLTFTADEAQTLTMSKAVATLEYSLDGINWAELGTKTIAFGGEKGKLRLRGKNLNGTATSISSYSSFLFSKNTQVACSGDIRTLVDYENYETANTSTAKFCYLFVNCTSLTTPPELPALNLADYCYFGMFASCANLIKAPELPAKVLKRSCYEQMFFLCTSLTEAPELPAMYLADYCYSSMFGGCTNLNKAPQLPAMNLTISCYYYMFSGCENLTEAPQLPAKTLVNDCYWGMFSNCSQLKNITMLATDISASNCLKYWLSYVSSTGTFIKAKEMTSLPSGNSGIPSGWTVKNYETNNSNSDKKLVGITIKRSYGTVVCTFTYNNSGQLVNWGGTQVSSENNYTSTFNYVLAWEGNKCTETCDADEHIILYYTFANNMMSTCLWGNWNRTFTYNNDNQLIRINNSYMDDNDTSYDTYHWENGKLMKKESREDSVELTYSGKTCKGFNPAIFLFENDILEDVNLALTNPELVGLRINHLVSSITNFDSVWDFSYTLYDDGYIKSCTVVETQFDGDKYTEEYIFEWE